MCVVDIDKLIIDHLYLVKYISDRVHRTIPAYVEYDDLYQEGVIGLIFCAKRFKESKSSFKTYAFKRIYGCMIDYMRRTAEGYNRRK